MVNIPLCQGDLQFKTARTPILNHMGCNNWLKGQGNNELSLKELSGKLALLMALVSANRTSELQALDLRFRSYTPEGVLFKLASLTKKRRVGAHSKTASLQPTPRTAASVWCTVYVNMKRLHRNTGTYRQTSQLHYSFPMWSLTSQ